MLPRLSLFVILCLTACASKPGPVPASAQIARLTPSPEEIQPTHRPVQGDTPMNPMPPTPLTPNLQNLIEKAKEDLALRLSIPVSQIIVSEARDVTWSNASLGCPQPGMVYADVLTPGYLILLNVNGQDYEYHAGKNSDAFFCENPTPSVPGMTGDT